MENYEFASINYFVNGNMLFERLSQDTGLPVDEIRPIIGCEYYYETGYVYWTAASLEDQAEETSSKTTQLLCEKMLEYISKKMLPLMFYILCH